MSTSAFKGTGTAGRKLPAILKRPLVTREDYELRVGPGWTLNDKTFDHVPQTKRRKRDVPHPIFVDLANQSMYGLSSLQLAHDAPITLCAMDVATEFLWKCLPQPVRALVEVAPPNGPELWSYSDDGVADMYQRMDDLVVSEGTAAYQYYTDLKQKPWGIWPIWVEDEHGADWVVLFWYSETGSDPAVYDVLRTYEIFDPRRHLQPPANASDMNRCGVIQGRLDRIRNRWFDFFHRGGIDTTRAATGNARMCPMAPGEFTSGERCFAAVKELLNVVYESWVEGVAFDPATNTLPSLSKWVNPYQFRIEMTGINAWTLMSTFGYNARIAVEILEPEMRSDIVVDGRRRVILPSALAGPVDPPVVAENDYCNAPVAGESSSAVKSGKSGGSGGSGKSGKSGDSGNPIKSGKSGGSGNPGKSGKSGKSGNTGKSGRGGRSRRPRRPVRPGGSGRRGRPGGSGRAKKM